MDTTTAFEKLEKDKGALYRKTLTWEVFSFFLRWFLSWVFLAAILLPFALIGYLLLLAVSSGVRDFFVNLFTLVFNVLVLVVAFYPISASWQAYKEKVSGLSLTRFVLGARETSEREQSKLDGEFARTLLRAEGENKINKSEILGFSETFVMDSPIVSAYLIGTTLYISSGAIESDFLGAILAHELGHLNRRDGGMVAALRLLIFPVFQFFIGNVRSFSTNRPQKRKDDTSEQQTPESVFYSMINGLMFFLFSLFGGGVGMWVNSFAWASWFRDADYMADFYAVDLGMKAELVDYLEENKFYDTSVPYMLGWQPANELRIDALNNPEKYLEKIEKRSSSAFTSMFALEPLIGSILYKFVKKEEVV